MFIEEGSLTLLLFKYLIGHLLRMNHIFSSENRVRKVEERMQKCGCGNIGMILFLFAQYLQMILQPRSCN